MSITVAIIIGIVIELVVCLIVCAVHTVGVIKINKTNEEKDQYLFEMGDLDDLEKKKWVILKVKIEGSR